jgi:release factor glutamine methyltransferase
VTRTGAVVEVGAAVAVGAPVTRVQRLADAREKLALAGVPSHAEDAEALLLHALGVTRAAFWSEPSRRLEAAEEARVESLISSRARRVPLQLLIGETDFHRATLSVEPGVFIPRPETECLVEAVLAALHSREIAGGRPGFPPRGTLLDLGTGTGAIPIALLLALPDWRGFAVDRSGKARDLTDRNARRNGVADRLLTLEADFRDPALPGVPLPVDVLTCNPPYIPSAAIPGLMPEVRDYDPLEALDGGPGGLDALHALVRGAPAWLAPGGILAIEIGDEQADASMELFGPLLTDARVARDLAGKPRILVGTRRG